jgi:hypothetical protein
MLHLSNQPPRTQPPAPARQAARWDHPCDMCPRKSARVHRGRGIKLLLYILRRTWVESHESMEAEQSITYATVCIWQVCTWQSLFDASPTPFSRRLSTWQVCTWQSLFDKCVHREKTVDEAFTQQLRERSRCIRDRCVCRTSVPAFLHEFFLRMLSPKSV